MRVGGPWRQLPVFDNSRTSQSGGLCLLFQGLAFDRLSHLGRGDFSVYGTSSNPFLESASYLSVSSAIAILHHDLLSLSSRSIGRRSRSCISFPISSTASVGCEIRTMISRLYDTLANLTLPRVCDAEIVFSIFRGSQSGQGNSPTNNDFGHSCHRTIKSTVLVASIDCY